MKAVGLKAALIAAIIALSAGQLGAQPAPPSQADCEKAKAKSIPSVAEVERMTPQQKAETKRRLEAHAAILLKCLKAEAANMLEKAKATLAAAKEDCERRGQPKIGMTPAELVETCWRKPRRIVKKTTTAGVEESYVYGIGHVVKIVDGRVSEIVEAR